MLVNSAIGNYMFVHVSLLEGFGEPLLYAIPKEWERIPVVGSLITVPLRNKNVTGVVIACTEKEPKTTFKIRAALKLEAFPEDPHYFPFIQKLSNYHHVPVSYFVKRLKHFFSEKKRALDYVASEQDHENKTVFLTPEQQIIVDAFSSVIENPTYFPAVLHGVTGSGKTEIYKKALCQVLEKGKTALLLLPEVTLAVQFEQLLKKQLPSTYTIVSFHSATSAHDRKILWQNLLEEKPQLIIGVHLPILLPISNLGLIIVDEEHDIGFQEKKHPKLNSKDAALWRAHLHNIPILLGSATPSLQSLHNVKTRGWQFFQLNKRFAGAFPTIKHVSLLDKKQRKNFWISRELELEIKDKLLKREQTLIFLNRRGVSFFVQCKGCSFVFNCSSCSVSLTLHADESLRCHYCNYKRTLPAHCPECKEKEFLHKGIGTQQVVSILQKMFPTARIARADLDTTVNRKIWKKTISDFENRNLDILVGTQTITKGYHFPHVTLVGILWADINLHFPLFNASETTLQQLIQVAGRAGRSCEKSTVILQTMGEHKIFNYITERRYPDFYEQEIAQRYLVGYPPTKRLQEIELKHQKEEVVETEAHRLVLELINHKALTVLGPAQPPVARIKKIFSRKIYIKAESFTPISEALKAINQKQYKSSLFFTPNPQT